MCSPSLRVPRLFALVVIIFAALAVFPSGATAQTPTTGSVTGRVYDVFTDQYLRNVEIQVVETGEMIRSEEWGNYRLDNLPAGTVTLNVSYSGRETRSFKVQVSPGATTQMELELGGPPTAQRPQAKKDDDDIVMLEKFVVAADLEGNAKALMEQKSAMNMKSVVASDAFGDIAEGNVAEFLQNLPGIVIDYVDDEARGVSIRGMDAKYAIVTQDGARLPSSSSTTNGDMRSMSFEQMNVANADIIEVNKLLTADLHADAPAGSINIRTASPLDRKRVRLDAQFGFTVSSAFQGDGRIILGDKLKNAARPGGSISYSNNFFGRKLGVHFTASVSDYLSVTESMSMTYYPGGDGREPPWIYAITAGEVRQLRRRSAAALSLDWQATHALRVSLKTTWSDSWREVATNNITFGTSSANASCSEPFTYLRVRDNTGVVNSGGFNFIKQDTLVTIMPGFTYRRGNTTIDGYLAYAKAKTSYDDMEDGYFGRVEMGVNYLTFGAVRANAASTAWNIIVDQDLENPSNYTMRNRNGTSQIASRPYRMSKETFSGAVNFKHVLNLRVPVVLKTGLSYRTMDHNERRPYQYWTYLGRDGVAGTSDEHFADKVSPFTFDQLLGHLNVTVTGPDGTPMSIPVPDRSAFARELELHPERFSVRTDDAQLSRYYDAWDQCPAAYVMGNVNFGDIQCQAGLRFESYNIHMYQPYSNDYTGWEWKDRTYNNFFASASAKWSFTRNTMLRAGFAQSVLYPDINKLRSFVPNMEYAESMDEEDYDEYMTFYANQTGNWNLKPEKATDYSVEFEHYMKELGTFIVSVYYKDVRDVQYQRWYSNDRGNTFRRKWENYDKFDYFGSEISYAQSFRRMKIMPRALRGITVSAHYARNFLKSKYEVAQGGTAEHSAGARIQYRYKRLYAALAGNYVGERFQSMREASKPDEYTGELYFSHIAEIQRHHARLSFNLDVQYDLSAKRSRVTTKLVLAGRNIFNEPMRRYSNEPSNLTYIGILNTQWTLSIKASM